MSAAPSVGLPAPEATRSAATVVAPFENPEGAVARWLLAQGDRSLVLAQRLGGLVTRAPEMDDDLAVANIAIDLIGQATMLYDHVGVVDGSSRNADDYAFWRDADQFLSPRLVERPDVDFAHTVVRQFLHDAFAVELWAATEHTTDATIAAIADRTARETAYHLRYSTHWLVVLGSATPESRRRVDDALGVLWPDAAGLFVPFAHDRALADAGLPDPARLRDAWQQRVDAALVDTSIELPPLPEVSETGHVDGFDDLIGEMQALARRHPGASW